MRLVVGHDAAVAAWVAQHGIRISEPYVAFGIVDASEVIRGAWVWTQFYPKGNIEMTVVGKGCWYPGILRACFRYAFVTCECSRVTARIRRGNTLVRRLLPRMGFKFEMTQKRYFGPLRADDGLVFALFPDRAEKWLNG